MALGDGREPVPGIAYMGVPALSRSPDSRARGTPRVVPPGGNRLGLTAPNSIPWVLGPGTADTRLLASTRRTLATKGANLVIRGGVVSGTWRVHGDGLEVS